MAALTHGHVDGQVVAQLALPWREAHSPVLAQAVGAASGLRTKVVHVAGGGALGAAGAAAGLC